MTIPTTTGNQYNPVFAGDYVVYSECSPNKNPALKRTCDSKLFDIRTGTIREFSPPVNNLSDNGNYEYNRNIQGFSGGQFLIEEIQGGKREFGLYTIDQIRPATEPAAPAGEQSIPSGNGTAAGNPGIPKEATEPSPGFDTGLIVMAFLISGIILRK